MSSLHVGLVARLPVAALVPAALAALAAHGCASAAPDCVAGADCASGACRADGTCVPVDGPSDAGATGSDAAAPPGSGGGPFGSDAAPPGECLPDGDGTILRAEVPFVPGAAATFLVAENAPVSTAGTTEPDGTRRWDLSGALPGDALASIALGPLEGRWFAGLFPGATYAAPLGRGTDLEGVFEATSDSLLLRGVVSPAGGSVRTELVYDPPVPVVSFPLAAGAAWTVTSTVTGLSAGVPSWYTESYASEVDASGTLETPLGIYAVQRIGTNLVRTVGLTVTTSRTYLFVAECAGTVASIASWWNELSPEFVYAAEVRRVSP